MNILVVNPANAPYTNASILAEPIDVLQIATIIWKQYPSVRVVDMDGIRLENNLSAYLKEENIVIFVYDYQLPLHTSAATKNIFETISSCQKKTKFIMIGKTSSYYYENFLSHGIDIVIQGIVDEIILPVIDTLIKKEKLDEIPNLIFKRDEQIIHTKKEKMSGNFSLLPIPNRELLDLSYYMDTRTMITSRGCIGHCKFCTTPYFFGGWSSRSVSQVIEEIRTLVTKYGAKKIMFLDDNATVNKKRMLEICEGIKQLNISCLFGCLSSTSCYDKELFQKMYQVGFRWVHFGLESGSKKVLEKMNKILPFDITRKIIREVKEMGYRVRTSFILDYPGTDVLDLQETRKLILELEPHELRLHYLAYRVGTPVFLENGSISTSQYIHQNHSDICSLEMKEKIEQLIFLLKDRGYFVIKDEVDWNYYQNFDSDTKVAAFTPIKYGMCWYE